jgi:hypothetical protein
MKPVKSNFPFGTIGVPTGLLPRWFEFTDSLDALQVPDGTTICRKSSCDIVYNLNRIVLAAVGDWILFWTTMSLSHQIC